MSLVLAVIQVGVSVSTMKSKQDCAPHESSRQQSSVSMKMSAAKDKDDPSFYDSALAAKLAAEDERLESSDSLPSPLAESLPVDVPWWHKQKCRLIIIAAALGMVVAVAIAVPLVLAQTSVDGDNDQENNGASAELTSRKNPEREAIIADRLALVTPGGNETLMDPNTPQYRAWQWLVYDDEMKLDPSANNLLQRYLLMVIHFPSMVDESDDGKQWGSSVHECEWEEVQCKYKVDLMYEYGQDNTAWIDDTPERIVTGLTLSQRLNGQQIPEELSLLSFLQHLDLGNNKLIGSLPSHIYELQKLDTLILSQNQLTSVDDIGEFKHLEHLSLSMNNFMGPLPTSFQNLKHLKTLDLHTNEFTGDLFKVIDAFESLEIIDVAFNDFTGTISPLIGSMTNLKIVLLGNNQFSGGIPEEIQFCSKLEDLSVEANHDMGGLIPSGLGQLTSLVYLNLSTCGFEGALPASFGELKKLKFLDVTFNNLDGALPKELGSATSLTTLGLAYNEFDGSIPSEFGLLTSLEELVIQNTNLKGAMPQEICTLRQEGILKSITTSCDNLACTCCDCN